MKDDRLSAWQIQAKVSNNGAKVSNIEAKVSSNDWTLWYTHCFRQQKTEKKMLN